MLFQFTNRVTLLLVRISTSLNIYIDSNQNYKLCIKKKVLHICGTQSFRGHLVYILFLVTIITWAQVVRAREGRTQKVKSLTRPIFVLRLIPVSHDLVPDIWQRSLREEKKGNLRHVLYNKSHMFPDFFFSRFRSGAPPSGDPHYSGRKKSIWGNL